MSDLKKIKEEFLSKLKNRLNLVKALDLTGLIYSFKTTTEGIFIFIDGELTYLSYSATTFILSMKTPFIVSFHDHIDKGKYDNGR